MKAKQNAIKIARTVLVALTFILAFAIIIATPIESSTEVAFADIDSQIGTAVGIYGNSGELTADKYGTGFPGSGSNVTVWSHNETFSNVKFSSSNVSACSANTTKPIVIETRTGEFKFAKNGNDNDPPLVGDGYQVYAVVNYQLSPFLKTMISNTNATVQFTGFSAVFERASGSESSYRVFASSAPVAAASCGVDDDVTKTGFTKSGSKNWTITNTSAITLASSHNVIAMAFEIGGGTDGDYPTGYIHDIKLSFKITITQADYSGTVINDGEAPILQSVDSKSPFRTDNTINSGWNYYPNDITTSIDEQVAGIYNNNLDKVDANNNVYLHSFVNAKTDGKTTSGVTYYKELNETFVDQYSYGSSTVKTADGNGQKWYASGIKSVKVGDSYLGHNTDNGLWAFDQEGKSTALKEIKVEGVTVGWGRVYAYHRSKIQVQLYFAKNVDLSITVTDYGGMQVTKTISVKGIDLDDPSAMETIVADSKDFFLAASDYVDVASYDNIKWTHTSSVNFEFNEDNTEQMAGHTPYMWFYSVMKADNPADLFESLWDRDLLMNKLPFAINTLAFTYDFTTGLANGEIGNQNGDIVATGSGYYLFSFYKMDMSGRFDETTGVISYYVKVDYEAAYHTLDKSSNGVSLDNPDWAAGDALVITLTQDKPNISGNTLTFITLDEGDMEVTQNIFVKDGMLYTLDENGAIVYAVDGRVVIHSGGRTVYVEYTLNAENKAVWTITFASEILKQEQGKDIFVNYNYVSTFEIATGVDLENENLITYIDNGETVVTNGVEHGKWQYKQGGKYIAGVHIRADRNAPIAPNFMNSDALEEEYIFEMSEFVIPSVAERTWYTSGWTFPGQFDFSDDLAADFGGDIKVYYAMKNVVTEADFENIERFARDYEGGYDNITSYGFDLAESYKANELDDLNALNLALDSKLGAGMRVIFFWTADQAGNRSALNKYYILADATTYYVTGRIDNGIFDGQTDVTMVSGGSKTAVKRGQSAVIEYAISDDSAYVPYKFMMNNGGEELATLWVTDNPTSKDVSYDQAPVSVSGTTLTLVMDDENLGQLQTQSGQALDVYFVFREYVEISVLNNSVYYEGAPTTVPYTISNENAKPYVEYNFEGFETNVRPTNVGEYSFTMHIDSDSYITDAPVAMEYFINKRSLSIVINSTTGRYGDGQSFGYTVNGLVGADLEAWDPATYTFTAESGLALPSVAEWIMMDGVSVDGNDFSDYNVGSYRLSFNLEVSNGYLSDNYALPTLTEARHIISQREIVVSAVNGTKVYGDNDGNINFTVDLTSLPQGIDSTNITDIIKNAQVVSADGNIITLTGDALISRNAGEDVGEYSYKATSSSFDTDTNYKVVVDVQGKVFTITKRTVVVTPNSGQEFAYNEENNYNVGYALDDYRFADALVAVWNFTQSGDVTEENGFEQITLIVGGVLSSNNTNVEFVLTDGVVITVKKAVDGNVTIVITKDGASYKVYDGNNTLDKVVITGADGQGFAYAVTGGELPQNFRIEFTPAIDGVNVGNYMAMIDEVKVYDGDTDVSSEYTVFVESYTVSITPATISVRPTFASTEKIYGDMDTAYGFGYEINANGFDNIDFASVVSGSFVRAIYHGAEVVGYGERYDGVSNADGTYEKNGVQYRYGVAVGNVFTSSNANFTVVVEDLEGYVLVINPKTIDFSTVDTSKLYANDKVFNNSPVAVFGEGEKELMFDIASQLVRLEDNVYVDFTALFTDYTEGDNKTVIFSDFVLVGEDSANYVLVGIEVEFEVTSTREGNPIKITSKALVIEKRYFNITKVYDGTSIISEEHIVIDSECMLSGVEFYIANPISFNGANVTNNFATDLVLIFVGIDESTFIIDEGSREYISIESEGLKLSLSLVPGTITAKEIALGDFANINAVDRIYNGKDTVDMTFDINNNVFGEGDNLADLGIKLVATASDANVGTKAVTINDIVIGSANYKVNFTAQELSNLANARVEIARAQVELNVQYNQDKEYNGRLNALLTKVDGAYPADIVKGDGYAFRLISNVDMDGNAWANEIGTITWDFDAVNFYYTIDGQVNGSVAFVDGEVVDHNVKVSGLALSSTNPQALNNYEIVAYAWNDTLGQYEVMNIALAEGTLADFECLAVAPMARKVITANNSITVLPKIYDGTKTAYATANITTELGVAAEDTEFVDFAFDAHFDTKDVGKQKVSLRIIGFVNKDNAPEDVASNYLINSSSEWIAEQSILPAPVLVTANVGEKVYDGTNALDVAKIKYTLTGVYPSETDLYGVDVLAGHYDDANVFDADGNICDVKGAKLYGIALRNLSTSRVNYYPVFASAEKIDGLTEIAELGALPAVDENGQPVYYYQLNTENVYELTQAEFVEVADSVDMTYFIDTYTRAGKVYYLFSEGANIQGKTTKALAVDTDAVGKINQREVTMIIEVLGKDAFNKVYDGTNIFGGIVGVDYNIGMTSGFIGTDGESVSLDQNKFTVAYTTSKAGVAEVRFVFEDGALASADGTNIYLNYTASGATYVIKGSIKKAEMNAVLNAINGTYGDDVSKYQVVINYSINVGGEEYAVIIDGTKGYMAVSDYAEAYNALWLSLTLEEQNARRYNLVDGVFTKDENGEYVVLPDTFVEPSMVTNATKQAITGTYKATLAGGNATNYNFNFRYSKFVDGNSTYDATLAESELVIGKKTLKVSAVRGDGEYSYKANYLEGLPTIVLSYYGFVGNDGTNKITVSDGAVAFKFFNGTDYVDMPENPVPTSELEEGQYYVAVVDTTKLSASNYDFEVVGEAKLEIVMPAITGVTIKDTTVAHNGSNQESNIAISGNLTDIAIEYEYYVGSVAEENRVDEIKNVGTYIVVAKLTKTVGAYTTTTTLTSTMTVEKSNMSVGLTTAKYDYQDRDFIKDIKNAIYNSLRGVANADRDAVLRSLTINFYEVEEENQYIVKKVEDVGEYMVEVIFTAPTTVESEEDIILQNYNDYSYTFNFKVIPAPIVITILASENSMIAEFDEEGKIILPETLNFVFKYDFSEEYKAKYGVDAGDLDADKFQVQFSGRASKVITGAGTYEFAIYYLEKGNSDTSKYDADKSYTVIELGTNEAPSTKINKNYRLTGNVGVFNVSTPTISGEGLTMEYLDGKGIVSAKAQLVVTEITEYVEDDALYAYWLAVDSYTPYIKEKDKIAKLDVIMQIRLMNNGVATQPGGQVKMTVEFILEHPIEEYVFYAVGKDGALHLIEDVVVNSDGTIQYTTDYIDSVVAFRMIRDESQYFAGLPIWVWIAIGGGVVLVILIVSISCGVAASKKKKKKGEDPDGDKPNKPNKKEEKAAKKAEEQKKAEDAKKAEAERKAQAEQKAKADKQAEADRKAKEKADAKKAEAKPVSANKAAPMPTMKPKATAAPGTPVQTKPATAPAQPTAAPKVTAPSATPTTAKPAAAPAPKTAPPVVGTKPVAPAPAPAPAKPTAPAPAPAPAKPVAPAKPSAPPVVGTKPAPSAPAKPATPPVVGTKPATPPVVGNKPNTPPVVGKK